MDALEFAKLWRRMYKTYNNCDRCPLYDLDECDLGYYSSNEDDDIKIINFVEQWAKEHPAKTRQSEYIKLFHCENLIADDGYLDIYPCNMGYKKSNNGFKLKNNTNDCCESSDCENCKKRFWLEEIEQ